MARKKTNSAAKTAYNKHRKRIINFIRRAEKRGFYFDENILPPIPKRITSASIRRLERLTPEALYKRSFWVDEETGEFMSGPRRVEVERSERSRKAYATRRKNKAAEQAFYSGEEPDHPVEEEYYPDLYEIVFDNVWDEFITKISRPPGEHYYSAQSGKKLKKWQRLTEATKEAQSSILALANQLLATDGKQVLGKRLADNWTNVEMSINYILYGSDAVRIATSATQIMMILQGSNLTPSQNRSISEEAEEGGWEEY